MKLSISSLNCINYIQKNKSNLVKIETNTQIHNIGNSIIDEYIKSSNIIINIPITIEKNIPILNEKGNIFWIIKKLYHPHQIRDNLRLQKLLDHHHHQN